MFHFLSYNSCCINQNSNASGCAYIAGVSSIQSTFSLKSVLVNRHRAGIALISPTHLSILLNGMLATYSISLSVKRINPSAAMLGLEFHQLALIAGQLWFTPWAHTGARISWNSYNWWVFSYLTSFYTYFQEKPPYRHSKPRKAAGPYH